MSYQGGALGAVAAPGRSLAQVRGGLARLLGMLERLPSTLGDKKFLPTDDPVMLQDAPELRSIVSPTLWTGSNVIAWPAGDWRERERDWNAAVAALGVVGDLKAFALQRKLAVASNTRGDAITATRSLLGKVDAAIGTMPMWPWLVAAGVIGVAWYSTQPGAKKAVRKARRRLFKRRTTRTYY